MNKPPQQPWSSSPQPPASGSPGSIQVGGPNGVVIHGDRVQVGGMVVHPGTQGSRPVAPRPTPAQIARTQSTAPATLDMELFLHPRRLPRLLMGGGVLFGMMAILLAMPAMGMPVMMSVMASLFAVLAIGGAFVLRGKSRQLEKTRALPPSLELGLLELAHQSGGELCVPDTARALQIPLDEAQEALERLAKRGHAQMDVKEGGELVYKITQGTAGAPNALPSSTP